VRDSRVNHARHYPAASTRIDRERGSVWRAIWPARSKSRKGAALPRACPATIRRLIAQLPEPFHEIIVLREINDLSYREIADLMEVPVGTVTSRLARARSMLRKAWTAAERGPCVQGEFRFRA
jgi:predicted DNA-binding protein (UPF0251 family)